MAHGYPQNVQLYIDGKWRPAGSGDALPIENPATAQTIGDVAKASAADLAEAVAAADRIFPAWRDHGAFARYQIMRKAAMLVRDRNARIAEILTTEQGKPIGEAAAEVNLAADLIDWFAEEARRAYGRLVPPRLSGVQQVVSKEPVGPVAAFTPWNFPVNQAVRKVSAAIAAGCTIVIKGPEETPASCAELIRAFVDAGVPSGVINLVFGDPSEISHYLITHPRIRKITFTGSTPVGKKLAALAGAHMKRITMELGGHAPVLVFEDADLDRAVNLLCMSKFRNAGQVCVSPTRFLVHEKVHDTFVDRFVAKTREIRVGNGLEQGTSMGPLANSRRVEAVEGLIADAVEQGAKIRTGGKRIGNQGHYFEPTVLTQVTPRMRIMNDEPFGPVAPIMSFRDFGEAMTESNRLDYGLASYVFTRSDSIATAAGEMLEAGMVTINHLGLSLPELPFGGIKDSGFGSEGGLEAMENYFNTKLVTKLAGPVPV